MIKKISIKERMDKQYIKKEKMEAKTFKNI
jgi:hypothetical protein